MTNILDIVNRIENAIYYSEDTNVNDLFRDAVDEIERLRSALQLFACDCGRGGEKPCHKPENCRNYIARAALEGRT